MTHFVEICIILLDMKKFIKKGLYIFLFAFVIITCCSCAGSDKENANNNSTQKQVQSIVIEDAFYTDEFFVGEAINLQLYDVTINFSDQSSQTFKLGDVYRNVLDTSSVGTKSFVISYLSQNFTFQYEVKAVYIKSATVKQTNIVVFDGENDCLDDVDFTVLYSNGEEKVVKLKDATVEIAWSGEYNTAAVATVTYNDFNFTFNCVVKLREIMQNEIYELDDKLGLFDCNVNVTIAQKSDEIIATFFHLDGDDFKKDLEAAVTLNSNGKYEAIIVYDGLKTIQIYAYKDKVVLEEKQD